MIPAARYRANIEQLHWPPTIDLQVPRRDCPAIPESKTEVINAEPFETKTDEAGNEYIQAVPKPGEDLQVVHRLALVPMNWRSAVARWTPGELPAEARRFLGPTSNDDGSPCMEPGGPNAQAAIGHLRLDGLSEPEKLERIMLYWHGIQAPGNSDGYEPPRAGMHGTETLLRMKGADCCFSQALTQAALARAAGIPARVVSGIVVSDGDGSGRPGTGPAVVDHTVAEYYLLGVGWVLANSPNWSICKDWYPCNHASAWRDPHVAHLDYLGCMRANFKTPGAMRVTREWV